MKLKFTELFGCLFWASLILLFSGCSSSLHQAVELGDLNQLKTAIEQGISVDEQNLSGNTALHLAAEKGELEISQFLLKKGASSRAKNSYMETPIHLAAAKGRGEILELLIQAKGNIHGRDHHGNTPLLLAAQNGHGKIIKILLRKGANERKGNHYRETPRSLAAQAGYIEVVTIIDNASDYSPKISPPKWVLPPQPVIVAQKDITGPKIRILSPRITRGISLVHRGKWVTISGIVLDESTVKQLTVNGQEAAIDNEGNFNIKLKLKPGKNHLFLAAIDRFDNQSKIDFYLDSREIIKAQELPLISGSYHALIIGNNTYSDLPDLVTAQNDAIVIDQILRQEYGFKTNLLLDATKVQISRALNNYRKKLDKKDLLLIYYAGHGYYDKTVNKAYWWPVDAEPDDDTNWIIADTITASIQRIASSHILIIADSCYSGTLTRGAEADFSLDRGRNEFLKKMSQRGSRTLMASGGNEPVSDGGGGDHSIFAQSLINGLQQTSQKIFTAEELFSRHIKESVAGKSDQVPEYSIIRNSGHDGGDFIFIKQ